MKHLAMLTAAILLTAASFYIAWLLWDVFVLFFVSVALAAALRPLVIQMRSWNLSDSTAILICYAALLVLLALLVFIYGGLVGNELNIVLDQFPVWYDGLRQRFATGAGWQQSVTGFLPSSEVIIRTIANFGLGGGSTTLLNLSSSVLNGFIFIIGVLSLGYYWLVDQNRFERLWLSLLPVPARVRARGIWRGAENEIGTYVRVELAIVVTVSLFLLGIYTLIGLPFAALLSLMSGLVQLLPWLGGSLMLIVTFAVALSTGNILTALVVLAVGLAQEPILAYLLRPYMYRNAKKLNSLLVVVMLLTLGSLGGLTAALLAQPVAVLLQVFYQNIVLDPQRVARTDALPELQRLSERTDALEVALQEDDESNPALRSLVRRVRSLVNRAHEVVTVSEEQTAL